VHDILKILVIIRALFQIIGIWISRTDNLNRRTCRTCQICCAEGRCVFL